jgi:hypothetical protein
MNQTIHQDIHARDVGEPSDEPLTAEELLRNLMQDLVLGNPPDEFATELIEDFIMKDRPETPQVLAMLDGPTETLLSGLKAVVIHSNQTQIEALDRHGPTFIERLKVEVKRQLEAATTEVEVVKNAN